MATPDVPEAAVEAAAKVRMWQYDSEYDASHLSWPHFVAEVTPILAAAAPHIEQAARADERARVLDEVQAALRDDGFARWKGNVGGEPGNVVSWVADYLRDTLGAGGEGG